MTALKWLQVAAVAWCVWLPVSQGEVLYPALAVVLATSVVFLLRSWRRLSAAWLWAALVYYSFAIIWTAGSYLADNAGVVHQAALWLGVPAVWGTWAASMTARQARRTLYAIVLTGTVSAVLVVLMATAAVSGWNPVPSGVASVQHMFFTISVTSTIEMSYLGLSSLIAVAALALYAALSPRSDSWLPSRVILVVAAAACFLAGITSGRRGFMVVVATVCVVGGVVGLVSAWRKGPSRRAARYTVAVAVAGCAVLIALMSPFGTNVPSPVRGAIALPAPAAPAAPPAPEGPPVGQDPADDAGGHDVRSELDVASDKARVREADELLASWRESPFWGHGFGATLSSGYERNEARPWMFEIEPLQALNSVGILGLLVLGVCASLLGSVVVRGFRHGRHPVAISAALTAAAGLLFACLTNPYLQAPAHDWALFLALALSVAAQGEGRGPTVHGADPGLQQRD